MTSIAPAPVKNSIIIPKTNPPVLGVNFNCITKITIMEELKFKTNINCMGCVAKFTPHIQDQEGVESWEVDTTNPDKVLTVKGDISSKEVEALVKEAGFVVREVIAA
ncbi:MAG: heavy metal-associated domain-containing protein [Haliscomenobacter sp.]|uniref:heavy-metal-associated domain-containing protein n=1 Tax=Haliscomenobacter sp. TaxID=2717303 RepID=UPI0029A8B376|nr:heavy metal-associated domain-containing protein [Haliscomenobacter sp.]MDX2071713.1 heavy metal-associated domain-containing protein [Haliscomenobacter sp.]